MNRRLITGTSRTCHLWVVGAEILDERVLHEGEIVETLPNLLGSLGVFRFRRRR